MKKVIVAHPGRQHSFRLASALKKVGMLNCYVTTIYNGNHPSLLMRVVKRFLSVDNLKRANNRTNSDLEDAEVIQFCELGGLLEAFLTRVDKSREIYRYVHDINTDRFGIKVAKLAIRTNADAVVMYDSNAGAGFEYLKIHAPNIVRIMDISSTARPYLKKVYETEIKSSGHNDMFVENRYLWNDTKLHRLQKEIDLTQYFLAASQFVKHGLMECGVREEQIKIVPYGANVSSDIQRQSKQYGELIRFLYVGQIVYRKGVPYLLKAFAKMPKEVASLVLTGNYNKDDWFVKDYLNVSNILFTGMVTPDHMKNIYEEADVFVFPSFAEGMAQVGIEAMACGLPIICTLNSGVSDLVVNGVNGFIIPFGNADAILEKMQWFVDHPEKIIKMGMAAKETAKRYTWDAYEKNVAQAISTLISEE